MVRTVLAGALGVGLGVACQIPNTLGLACGQDSHCDAGQICVDDVCAIGTVGDTGGDTTGPAPEVTGTTTTMMMSSGAVAPDSSSGSSSSDSGESSSSTTAPACGTESCADLDILIVLDNSDSMFQWLAPLANSLPSIIALVTEELDKVCTFRIGLTSSNALPPDNPKECMFPGALLYRPESCGGGDGVLPWWSEQNGTPGQVLDELRCLIIDQGTGGSSDERMLEALLGALNPANNTDESCNAGFRRPSANLIVLYISDEDDPTPMDELDTVAENFLMWVDPDLVGFVSVVADDALECPWESSTGSDDGMGAELPTGLNGFLALSGIPFEQRSSIDICEDAVFDFEEAFGVFQTACTP